MSGALTAELPDPAEGPTNLERMLAGHEPQWSHAVLLEKRAPRWVPGRSSLSKKARKKKQRGR